MIKRDVIMITIDFALFSRSQTGGAAAAGEGLAESPRRPLT